MTRANNLLFALLLPPLRPIPTALIFEPRYLSAHFCIVQFARGAAPQLIWLRRSVRCVCLSRLRRTGGIRHNRARCNLLSHTTAQIVHCIAMVLRFAKRGKVAASFSGPRASFASAASKIAKARANVAVPRLRHRRWRGHCCGWRSRWYRDLQSQNSPHSTAWVGRIYNIGDWQRVGWAMRRPRYPPA